MPRRCGAFRRTAAACLAALSLLAGAPAARAQGRQGAHHFPNVTLTTQDGAHVRFYDDLIRGKIVAINLIYTSCSYACPLETARLAQVQKRIGEGMGRDVFFYSITIDPEHDTPEVLKAYAEKFQAGPGWLFLTGRREDIDLISRRIGLYSPPNPANADGHTPHLLVGSEATGQWIRNSGVDDPRFLATTLTTWMKSWRAPGGASASSVPSYADAPAIDAGPGQYSFTRHCAACHTIGGGDRVGPDLIDVTSSRDRAWLTRFIAEPDALRGAGDPLAAQLSARYAPAVMPRLGLTRGEVVVILEYIDERAAAGGASPPPAAASFTPPASRESLSRIVEAYLAIQSSLASGSLEGVSGHSREIALAAQESGPSAEAIRSAATAVGGSNLVAVRAAFAHLGDAILAVATRQPGALGPDVKVAYCPMARAHWLQRGTRIRNPYYGPQMTDCGRFVTRATRGAAAAAPLPLSPPQPVRTPGPVRAP